MITIAKSDNQVIKEILGGRYEGRPVTATYEIANYPQYKVELIGNNECFIIKEGEPKPYIPTFYSSVYAAVKAVETIEAFKTLMRAKKAAKDANAS